MSPSQSWKVPGRETYPPGKKQRKTCSVHTHDRSLVAPLCHQLTLVTLKSLCQYDQSALSFKATLLPLHAPVTTTTATPTSLNRIPRFLPSEEGSGVIKAMSGVKRADRWALREELIFVIGTPVVAGDGVIGLRTKRRGGSENESNQWMEVTVSFRVTSQNSTGE